ncbi:hypothetical protein XM38_028660 [Halomicronema hongdechloris C2206]|uniref:Peptidase C-terminal archaeal/bacterial domain-containing protein n=1 Tax=Halomicronema hongdechloris C2206 TaxID=1641165 RepID=A0A1Z3HNQ0_9CYAN|nr:DVUA0089 family protein [Halomicronema hongdechloris]ASC71912.1 hypothetical protein XM38_028660 [Halomicronema hongdechloris C2206]
MRIKPIDLKGVAVLSGLAALLTAAPAGAATFTEASDAGETLGEAIAVTTETMSPLESIAGSLAGDADLFQLFLTGGQQFSATTINTDSLIGIPIDDTLGSPSDLLGDPQLFLFDAMGNGVYANDDGFTSVQATLPSSFSLTPAESGIYFLGISSADFDPVSADGEIFPDTPVNGVVGSHRPWWRSPPDRIRRG